MLWKRVLKYKIHMAVASQPASSHLYLRSISTLPSPFSNPLDRHFNSHLSMHVTSIHKLPLEFSCDTAKGERAKRMRRKSLGMCLFPGLLPNVLSWHIQQFHVYSQPYFLGNTFFQAMGISFLRPHKGSIQSTQDSVLTHSSCPHLQSLRGASLHSLITMVLLLFFLQRLWSVGPRIL